ncbi:cysteine desulfurase sulfur acceptor subunit CsdE [Lonsdalea quercina]|uniref:cysteine desulfurase sulfur acceptor subunit CsdE n=1 Tax=Lonsdalea quercina TaxID=71657 RepID=UPI0039756003
MTLNPTRHPFGSDITEDDLRQRFCACRSWEDRYRQIILLAKQLPSLPEEKKQPAIALFGCENQVWLGYEREASRALHFYGDSDGRIVRGLLAILLTAVEGKTAAQLQRLDPLALLETLGLKAQLSASRSAGLAALAARIQEIASLES